ncbi:outer membrane beta-barrel protein [Novosphingobium sp. MMS21-SN21R]|uniref:outer membrane beta-barrel protein n=1 Tax=Novosphingobium sp. MMS21-SN21R TaxID=2969298 RepID=UPI002884C585|nr:outer membrane beta-barrel protein [Novosphingobium sp. MMS21-SN21R]MDT0508396.1 outer membrane beta-barrel protein [Novosphingobium sp. MMS21-SN21R]
MTTPGLNPDGPYFLQNVAGNRRQPGYEPVPHRLGSFVVAPSVTVRAHSDDNWTDRGQSLPLLTVIGTAVGNLSDQFGIVLPADVIAGALAQVINPALVDVGDVAFDLAPAIAVSSDWSRNALVVEASARFTRFVSIHRLNREEFRVATRGRIDLGSNTVVAGRVAYLRQAEPPGANGLAVLDYFGFGPSLFNRFAAGADLGMKFGRASVLLDAEYTQDRYRPLTLDPADLLAPGVLDLTGLPDSIAVSQSYRNRSQAGVRLRVTYSLAPDFDVYLVPSYGRIRQLGQASGTDFAAGIPSFASDTWGLQVGARKDFGHLFVVQAGLRYQDRNYVNSALVRSRRFDIEGAADWYPTRLISLRISAAQQFRGSGVPGQADIITRTISARADYEVLRNVGLRFEGSASWDRYPAASAQPQLSSQSARQDGSVQVVWNIGRSTEVNVSAGGHRRRAGNSIFLGSFAASRFSISLTRRL